VIYDFRPEATPEHRANAVRCVRGKCYLDGVVLRGVCYADTDAGIVAVIARNLDGHGYVDRHGNLAIHTFCGTVVVEEQDGTVVGAPSFGPVSRGERAYDLMGDV
jgi:hypothetical protein